MLNKRHNRENENINSAGIIFCICISVDHKISKNPNKFVKNMFNFFKYKLALTFIGANT